MSRLTQLAEMRALREDVEMLKKGHLSHEVQLMLADIVQKQFDALLARIEALEAKRGPGRPKKDE